MNEERDYSGISNFSMELDMLNKLHVQKNNFAHLSELPVMGDHIINDLSCSLYKEELDS